jgi:uncharacterized SAM-binding protein YcdF (DUF218 family)
LSRALLGRLGHALVRRDRLERADAVVVLGGAPRARCAEAAALVRAGWAPVVLCVGGRGAPPLEALRSARRLAELGLPAAAVRVCATAAPGTAEEAVAAVTVAQEMGWTRIIVVTSPYHTWRAGGLFDRRAGAVGLDARLVPTTHDVYDPDAWWRTARQRRLVRNEVLKFAWWTATLRRR